MSTLYCTHRGNYVDSLACCEKAQSLLTTPSHLAHGCLGMAHQYSGTGIHLEAAIEQFSTAHRLLADVHYEVSACEESRRRGWGLVSLFLIAFLLFN